MLGTKISSGSLEKMQHLKNNQSYIEQKPFLILFFLFSAIQNFLCSHFHSSVWLQLE